MPPIAELIKRQNNVTGVLKCFLSVNINFLFFQKSMTGIDLTKTVVAHLWKNVAIF